MKRADPIVMETLNKALDDREISLNEGAELLKVEGLELNLLTMVADELRRRAVGDVVTYVVNLNINFTNVCTKRCTFCGFSRDPWSKEAYFLPIEEVVRRAKEAWKLGATEVCIQAGLAPNTDAYFYAKLCREIKKEVPNIHIHAFSPEEIVHGARQTEISIEEHLKMLKEAGLDSLPGTAAEILDDEVRKLISPRRISVEEWVRVIKTAHRLGMSTTSTIVYGHVETPLHKAKHLILIREIQKETGGFTELVPLGFVHFKTPLYAKGVMPNVRPGPTGVESIKVHAVSRIILNTFIKNIQVSWVKEGPKLAQFCLNAGANDLGGTLICESISSSAGASYGNFMRPVDLRRLIRDLNRTPAQRSTTYEILKLFKEEPEPKEPLDKIPLDELASKFKLPQP